MTELLLLEAPRISRSIYYLPNNSIFCNKISKRFTHNLYRTIHPRTIPTIIDSIPQLQEIPKRQKS